MFEGHFESVSSCVVLELVPLALVDPDLEGGRRGLFCLPCSLSFLLRFFSPKLREDPCPLCPLPKSASVLGVEKFQAMPTKQVLGILITKCTMSSPLLFIWEMPPGSIMSHL